MANENETLEEHAAHSLRRAHAIHHDSEAASMALREREAELSRQEVKRHQQYAVAFAVGRVLLALVFLVSAFMKMGTFSSTQQALADSGIADSSFVLNAGITIELVLGALLLVGFQTRAVSTALVVYLICVTVLVLHDLSAGFNATFAMNNVGLCGGLLMLTGHGGSAWSIDRLVARREAQQYRG